MGVGLLEAAGRVDAGDGTTRGVQAGGVAEAVRDRVAEAGGGLRVAEDDGPRRLLRAQQLADPAAQGHAVSVDDGGRLRHVLAEHVGDEQVGAAGVAAQGEPQQLAQGRVALQGDAQAFGHPGAGPGAGAVLGGVGCLHESLVCPAGGAACAAALRRPSACGVRGARAGRPSVFTGPGCSR